MNIALYFGSFNPIHKGHIAIAEYMAMQLKFDQVWLVVSPHNPLKDIKTIANENSRFEMAKIGFANSDYRQKIVISDIEFSLSKPSYTIDTLKWLKKMYPTYTFSIIVGEDSLVYFKKWKDWQDILDNYKLLVYPRKDTNLEALIGHKNIVILYDAPIYPISSTTIREAIKNREHFDKITTVEVVEYIKKNKLYE